MRLACVVVVLAASVASAQPRSVLVLALDGDADPALRARLAAGLEQAAQAPTTTVTRGDTTLAETGAAVGCNHVEPSCADQVRVTLGADELVHGTASTHNGQTLVVVRRTSADDPMREATVVIDPIDLERDLGARLAPVFGPDQVITPLPPPPAPPPYDGRKRLRGILVSAAGGVSLVIGLTLWSTKASVQRSIDAAPTNTAADFVRLEDLERRAFRQALVGNVMVLGGLGLGAWGAWILYKDHQERRLTITPIVTPTGAAVTVGGQW